MSTATEVATGARLFRWMNPAGANATALSWTSLSLMRLGASLALCTPLGIGPAARHWTHSALGLATATENAGRGLEQDAVLPGCCSAG